jgi:hypothetical protein
MANDAAVAEPVDELEEEIDVEIEDDMFIDVEDEAPAEEEELEADPKDEFTLTGEDETGRNRAFEVYGKIEQSIIDYFSVLGNDKDKEMFYDYLITNMKLYFDKFEEELATKITEPTNPEYEDAKKAAEENPEASTEEPAPEEDAEDLNDMVAALG